MNIYLLELLAAGLPANKYDLAQGYVVIAPTAAHARKLVATAPAASKYSPGDEGADAWLDPKRTKVTGIGRSQTVRPRIVLRDFYGI